MDLTKLNLFITYIYRQLLGPFILIMISMTGIAWLTQSLRFIELIIIKGLPVNVFLNLTILIIPKLLVTIIPFVAFLTALITYTRLNTESELISMKSAGMSNFKILLPAVIFGITLGALTISIENYGSPYAYNKFKTLQHTIRNNYISTLFQEKVFASPIKGLTVFIKERDKIGNFQGILLHDERDINKTVSIIAEQGKIVTTLDGARFALINGNRQEISKDKNISILYFNEYTLNITNYNKDTSPRFRDASERNFYELFNPQENINALYKKEFAAEAHKRILTPLIIIIMVLIGAITSIIGKFNRKASLKKIFYSISAALSIQIYIIATPQIMIQSPKLVPFLYILIFIILLLIMFLVSDKAQKIKHTLSNKLGLY
jgi:lipopolysaccharide export system permease protein